MIFSLKSLNWLPYIWPSLWVFNLLRRDTLPFLKFSLVVFIRSIWPLLNIWVDVFIVSFERSLVHLLGMMSDLWDFIPFSFESLKVVSTDSMHWWFKLIECRTFCPSCVYFDSCRLLFLHKYRTRTKWSSFRLSLSFH